LEGTKSTIYTDLKSLATLMNQRKLNGRQSRWIEKIWCYEHQIRLTPGETKLDDPFSRHPDHETDISIIALLDVATHALENHHEDIKQGYLEDAFYQDPSHKRLKPLRQDNGLWYFRHRLCISDSKPHRQQLLRISYDTPYAGHQGKHTTLEIVSRKIWWPRMAADVTS
jgi:hypothetical protein